MPAWGRGSGSMGLLVLLVLILLFGGGSDDAGRSSDDPDPGRGGGARGEVERVIDGDTIEVNLDGATEDVRYIGVDTPETVKPGTPVQCFGKEASAFNHELVEGREVRLEFDRELRDVYGRLLAYVFVGDHFVNAELVEGGYARTLEIEPNTSRAEQLGELEDVAGAAGLGLWGAC